MLQFTTALDGLTMLVGDETKHGNLPAMMEQMKRVQFTYKGLKNKAEVADPDLMAQLSQALSHFLQRPSDEELCREACNFVPTLARGLTYRGADWAVVVMPHLLACLIEAPPTVSSAAYQGMCALVSHCYDEEGRLLLTILKGMDGTVRRQLYQLVKIVVEKWPPASVQPHLPVLREQIAMDMKSNEKQHCDWATQSFLVLSRKWPEHGRHVFHSLPREMQTKLVREHPNLQMSPSPRPVRRRVPSNSSKSTSTSPLSSPSPSSSASPLARQAQRRPNNQSSAAQSRPSPGKGMPSSSSERQQQLHQKLMRFKLGRDPLLQEMALRGDLSRPITWELSSEDGSTTSSMMSDGNGPNSAASRHTKDELRRRHKMNMMSPTDRQLLIAHEKAAHNVGMGLDSSPMMLFRQDLNEGMPKEEQMAKAATMEQDGIATGDRDRLEHQAFQEDEDDNENSGNLLGNTHNVTTRRIISSSSAAGKHVSFSTNEKTLIDSSPISPLFPPTPLVDKQDDCGLARESSEDKDMEREEEEEEVEEEDEDEDEEECFGYDGDKDEDGHISYSKKNLLEDIDEEDEDKASHESGEEEDDDVEEEEVWEQEDKDNEEECKPVEVVLSNQEPPPALDTAKAAHKRKTAARFLLVLSLAIILVMSRIVSLFPKHHTSAPAPFSGKESKLPVAKISFVETRTRAKALHSSNEPVAVKDKARTNAEPVKAANKKTQPAVTVVKKHWPFSKKDKAVVTEGGGKAWSSSSSSRQEVKKAPSHKMKRAWDHVCDAVRRLLNFRMLGVLVGYTLIYSFLV